MTSAFSWQNSVNLCRASFCTPRTNLPVTPGISWLTTFAFQTPMMKRTSFFLVLVLEVLQVIIEPFNFSFFGISGWGIVSDYCDIEWFPLKMNRVHSIIFEIAPKYCVSDSFFDYDGYSISFKGFLPTVVDIMVIWIKFSHSINLILWIRTILWISSLIPKMSMFTLAVSCLTT